VPAWPDSGLADHFGLTGTQMRDGNQGEGVGARCRRGNAVRIVDELDDRKLQGMATAQDLETIVVGAPPLILIGSTAKLAMGLA